MNATLYSKVTWWGSGSKVFFQNVVLLTAKFRTLCDELPDLYRSSDIVVLVKSSKDYKLGVNVA
jgi:hypothetical protein